MLAITKAIIVQTVFAKKKKYRYRVQTSLSNADVTDTNAPDNAFTVIANGGTWTFGTDTEEQRQQWVNALKQTIETLRSSSQDFEDRVSKITMRKATDARAAITKQYSSMTFKTAQPSRMSTQNVMLHMSINAPPLPRRDNGPRPVSPVSSGLPNVSNSVRVPLFEFDERELSDLENVREKKVISDVLARFLRSSSNAGSKGMPEPRTVSAPPILRRETSAEAKRGKTLVDVITQKSNVMAELIDNFSSPNRPRKALR